MTTFTVSTGQEAIAAGVAVTALVAAGLFISLGWIRGSLSISIVPPWNRKPAAKKTTEPATAATEAPVAGSAPQPVRKVS